MTNRITVNISLPPELDAFIQGRVQTGRYQTSSEVVREALRLLERQERERDDALRSLKAKLERGAAQAERGEVLDGEQAFEDLRTMIASHPKRRSRK
ncbi:MAG: type II toxin-antitoxin system ParD family antitoxin [Acidobacteria bacterium]|nr:type II toxin-antitoxin system ParD family antitoxin [Acidobacteriota bacterium]